MSNKSLFLFFFFAFNCFNIDAQNTFVPVNNVCSQLNTTHAWTEAKGTAYLRYSSATAYRCGVGTITFNPGDATGTATFVSTPSQGGASETQPTANFVINPSKLGESEGFISGKSIPFRMSELKCIDQYGFAIMSCLPKDGETKFNITVFSFSRTTTLTQLNYLFNCANTNISPYTLTVTEQGPNC